MNDVDGTGRHILNVPMAQRLIAERLADVSLSVAFGAYGTGESVLARMVFLLTQKEDSDPAELATVLSQFSNNERDAALLRAVADVMDALETDRLDGE